jgi:acetyl esterase/lipase
VQWLAGRRLIPPGSPLLPQDRLAIRHIISLGGLADLRQQQGLIKSCCGIALAQLTGEASPQRPDVFADTNAADLMPNGSHTVLSTGELDQISPPRVARDYAEKARQAGDSAETLVLPGVGHFDEVATSTRAWPPILSAIRRALGLESPR